MSDLKERLRRWPLSVNGPHTAELCIEAADEIERLQHHIQEHQSRDGLQQMEIERLREAIDHRDFLLKEACDRVAKLEAWINRSGSPLLLEGE